MLVSPHTIMGDEGWVISEMASTIEVMNVSAFLSGGLYIEAKRHFWLLRFTKHAIASTSCGIFSMIIVRNRPSVFSELLLINEFNHYIITKKWAVLYADRLQRYCRCSTYDLFIQSPFMYHISSTFVLKKNIFRLQIR